MALSSLELNVLTGLAEGRTLAQIGAAQYVSQPTLSKLLRGLQSRSGVDLVERRARRLVLTRAGEELAKAAAVAVEHVRDVDSLLERMHSGQAGQISIAATSTPANYVLPDILAQFLKESPEIGVELHRAPRGELMRSFAAGRWDIAVAPLAGPLSPLSGTVEGLPMQHLYDDPIVFFVGPESPIAGKRVEPEELADKILISPQLDAYWAHVWVETLRLGLVVGRRMVFDGLEGTKRLAEAGLAVGVGFKSPIARELAEGRLRTVEIAGIELAQPFYLVHRHRLTPAAERLTALIRERLEVIPRRREPQTTLRPSTISRPV